MRWRASREVAEQERRRRPGQHDRRRVDHQPPVRERQRGGQQPQRRRAPRTATSGGRSATGRGSPSPARRTTSSAGSGRRRSATASALWTAATTIRRSKPKRRRRVTRRNYSRLGRPTSSSSRRRPRREQETDAAFRRRQGVPAASSSPGMKSTRILTLTLVALADRRPRRSCASRAATIRPRSRTGAHAGQLTLKSCTYDTEAGPRAADCGTMIVRENRRDPKSRLIAIPVTRIKARSAHPARADLPARGRAGHDQHEVPEASRFADDHDVVLVGYRGVDSSTQLDCPEVDVGAARRRATC